MKFFGFALGDILYRRYKIIFPQRGIDRLLLIVFQSTDAEH